MRYADWIELRAAELHNELYHPYEGSEWIDFPQLHPTQPPAEAQQPLGKAA